MRPGRFAATALAALALAAPDSRLASAQPKSDWEEREEARNWKEIEVPLPAYPKAADLIPFEVSALATFRFFIDAKSISVGKDGVVRYTLVARSPSGVDNVTFEGMRCNGAMYRVYAGARSDGTWVPRPRAEWRPIEARTIQRWHLVLRRSYFCPQDAIIFDPEEGIDALKRGGHPRRGHTSND